MALIKIHFQEGYTGDEVIVSSDGTEVYRKAGVKTNPLLGLAATFAFECAKRPVVLRVSVPTKHISGTIKLDANSPPNLAVSIRAGKLEHHFSETEFAYA
jgi:hypothetical protein